MFEERISDVGLTPACRGISDDGLTPACQRPYI